MTTGRPRAFDREDVLETAMQLFWEKGYEATGKRELMEATGVASQSLYNTFGDKKSFFLETVRHYMETRLAHMMQILSAPGPALQNVRTMLETMRDMPAGSEYDKGCFLCNSLTEFGLDDDDIGTFLRQQVGHSQDVFAGVLEKAQQEGDLSPNAIPAELAASLICMCNGLAILRRSGASPAMIRGAVDGMLAMLERA